MNSTRYTRRKSKKVHACAQAPARRFAESVVPGRGLSRNVSQVQEPRTDQPRLRARGTLLKGNTRYRPHCSPRCHTPGPLPPPLLASSTLELTSPCKAAFFLKVTAPPGRSLPPDRRLGTKTSCEVQCLL